MRSPDFLVLVMVGLLLSTGCERKERARERDARAAQQRREQETRQQALRLAAPLPEEPPVEVLRAPHSGIPCAVDDVFARKCRRCHTVPTRHGAPFVFLTWEETQIVRGDQPLSALIGRAVRSGFMPYKIEANPKVEPLTDEEKKTILDWIDAGAPRKDCDETDAPSPSTSANALKPRPAPARVPP